MTLQQLYYIVELSKHTSISAAASALFIAQPSLSTAIKDLEKEFHITILKRNRHGITFTAEGLEFLNFANTIIEQTTNLREHFGKSTNGEHTIQLSIASQHYMFAVDALTAYLQSLMHVPGYTITFREERTSQVIHDVITQRSEIGIVFISKMTQKFMERTFRKNRLEFTELFSYPPYVFICSTHPLAAYDEITIEQLAPYPYIQYTQDEDSYQFAEEIVIPNINPKRTINITDRSTMFSIIAATDAYTVGSGILLNAWHHIPVKAIPIRNPLDIMRVGWFKQKAIPLSPMAQCYIDHLEETIRTKGIPLSNNPLVSETTD